MLGEAQAIARTPPRGTGTTDTPGACRSVATSGTSSAAQQLYASDAGFGAAGWWTFVATRDAHIAFGTTSGMNAAVATDWPLFQGVREEFWINANADNFFKVIQDATGGLVFFYPSNR